MICMFCHKSMDEKDYVEHDIKIHNGMMRVSSFHEQHCVKGDTHKCICRIAEYKAFLEKER